MGWLVLGALVSCSEPAAEIPDRRSLTPLADAAEGEWPRHGRDEAEQRFSPLAEIDRSSVARLGLAWSYETGTRRGLEATPIVVDGLMIATASWSIVFALDAATGEERWRFDPKVPGWKARHACCDVVNRGVAYSRGRIYSGTLDGRLLALDAKPSDLIRRAHAEGLDLNPGELFELRDHHPFEIGDATGRQRHPQYPTLIGAADECYGEGQSGKQSFHGSSIFFARVPATTSSVVARMTRLLAAATVGSWN